MPLPATLYNERQVEIPWLFERLRAIRPPTVIDAGAADAHYHPELCALVPHVTLWDVRPFTPIGGAPGASLVAAPEPPPGQWHAIISLSVLDHVGLDAYGQPADPDALRQHIATLRERLTPGGHLLVTVPVGRDAYTTHPGGGQRVFSRNTLAMCFPVHAWRRAAVQLWRRAGDAYQPVATWAAVADAGYDRWRADAVVGLHLTPVI